MSIRRLAYILALVLVPALGACSNNDVTGPAAVSTDAPATGMVGEETED